MSTATPLSGKRILIVEDEYLVAMELADEMEQLGAEIVALTGSLDEAMRAADDALDGALVDLQLGGDKAFAVAEKLRRARVPVILTTGYDVAGLPEGLRDCPRITKPFSPDQLRRMAEHVFVHG